MSAVELFTKIGLEPKTAEGTANNKKISEGLTTLIKEAKLDESTEPVEKIIGTHLLSIATKFSPFDKAKGLMATPEGRQALLQAILSGDIKSTPQCNQAIQYFTKATEFNKADFDKQCGVGIVITEEIIDKTIEEFFAANNEVITTQRYQVNGKLLGQLTSQTILQWATDKKIIKDKYDAKFLAICGEKLATDVGVNKGAEAQKARDAQEQQRQAQKTAAAKSPENKDGEAAADEEFIVPDDNFLQGRQLEWAINTKEQQDKHMEVTKGRVITRFPPEPNGYLHIGHAKAMMQNFGVADKFNGQCIMRFDDTNPEAEEQEYIDTILENLDALGHKPWKITYSSDYFDQLYDLAVKLVKKNKAYVCHQTKEQIKADREQAKKTGVLPPSPYRERSVEENLALFEQMKNGLLKENECTLRMKGDLTSPNPNMWDTVFYRIRYTPHPHTGNKWCIYPTYDYTHCIIDSLEDITYSMCTLEFEIRRESYFWLLYELDLYKPKVWEYSRLNITHNVLSKRRLRSLVMDNHVNGWDDPRLLTINGLRRRGFTGPIINKFIKAIGISRSATLVPMERLNIAAREYLNPIATRVMAVVDPIKVTIANVDADFFLTYQQQDVPGNEEKKHNITLSKEFFIDSEDFWSPKAGAVPADYKRMTLNGAPIHLRYTEYEMVAKACDYDDNGKVTNITVDVTKVGHKPAKGRTIIHFVGQWAPGVAPYKAEFRLYNELFKSPEPMPIEDWVADLNPESLVVQHGYVDEFTFNNAQQDAAEKTQYQFERVGYFILDNDAVKGDKDNAKLVFNRTCTLRTAPAPGKQ